MANDASESYYPDVYSIHLLLIITAIAGFISCENKGPTACESAEYPGWETSEYTLPYPPGTSYIAVQGNCTPIGTHWHWNSHTEDSPWAFAYDFLMPIGTIITAARAGEVVWLREDRFDQDDGLGAENALIIEHEDGTYAAYSHMTHQGVLVAIGDTVSQGDTIALSGNSGLSSIPHLHFQVSPCLEPQQCGSLPVTFRNTRPNPRGLTMGETYEALD